MLMLRGYSRLIGIALLSLGVFLIVAPFLWVRAAVLQV